MFLALEDNKALTSWPFVSEFTHITALKTFHCFDSTGFLEGRIYAFTAEPLCKFSGLTKVYSGFGKIPNSWCYSLQIKGSAVSTILTIHEPIWKEPLEGFVLEIVTRLGTQSRGLCWMLQVFQLIQRPMGQPTLMCWKAEWRENRFVKKQKDLEPQINLLQTSIFVPSLKFIHIIQSMPASKD